LPVGSSGGGSKRGLLIALVALVVLGLIGAGAYLVTKDDGDNSKVAASDNSETTVKSKASKTDATEATDATDGSDATDSSNTAAPGSVDVQVVSSGGSQFLDADGKPVGSWAAILENKGSAPAQLVQVDVEFKDAAGTVLGTDLAFVDLLPPGGKSAVRGDMLNVPAGVTTLSLTVDPSTIPPGKKIKPGAITVEGVKSTPDPTGLVITGTVKSTFAVELKSVSVVGVLFDASGKIIGGAFTFVDKLPSKGSAPLDMKDFDKVPGVDHVEVFVKLPTDLLT
jgi:hypothetical protein